MKLYDGGRAPNPRRVRVYLAEKGITVPTEQIDLGALQQRSPAYTAINPMQRVPALVLDDGTVIANRSPYAAISRRCSPTRRCSAAARLTARSSKCGTDAPNCTFFSPSPSYSSICIRR